VAPPGQAPELYDPPGHPLDPTAGLFDPFVGSKQYSGDANVTQLALLPDTVLCWPPLASYLIITRAAETLFSQAAYTTLKETGTLFFAYVPAEAL